MQDNQTPAQLGPPDTMKYLSLCSGIEAASMAWHHLGWQPFAFSEIEPFPCAVLAHHWPDVPNFGDMTQFHNWRNLEDVDLLVGGTPCQAFSVAGLRKSLDDARGNLTLTYISILNTIDNERNKHNRQPAICVWENVPGVLNTKDNAFGCFLAGLAGEDTPLEPPRGKWANAGCVYGPQRAVAWRVLDAQYFGVAQRRRRVFVVASARDGFDPSQILFEFDGLRRDIAPSREAGKGTATGFETGPSGSDEPVFLDRAMFNQGANAQFNPVVRQDGLSDALVARGPHAVAARMVAFGEYACDETASTMKQRDYKDATDLVVTTQYAVRRLTPRECERLQGFPDDHTLITWRGKPAADGPRYKACGNSMAVPVMRWIGERIQRHLNPPSLLAQLKQALINNLNARLK
jgi:site-specific DNA-cytosine methylase